MPKKKKEFADGSIRFPGNYIPIGLDDWYIIVVGRSVSQSAI